MIKTQNCCIVCMAHAPRHCVACHAHDEEASTRLKVVQPEPPRRQS